MHNMICVCHFSCFTRQCTSLPRFLEASHFEFSSRLPHTTTIDLNWCWLFIKYIHTHTQICCRWPTTTLMMPWIVLSCGHTSLIWWVVFSNEKDDLTTNTVRTVPVQNFDCTLEFCHAKTTHWLLGSCPTSKTLQSLIWKIDCNQIDDNKSETLLNILFLCEYVNNAYVH